jgi:hypothetical protein
MAKRESWFGILVITLVFGMSVIGCGGQGRFVLIDIPSQYNGKYAVFYSDNEKHRFALYGCKKINEELTFTASLIKDGKVTLPLWFDSYTIFSGGKPSKSNAGWFVEEATVLMFDTDSNDSFGSAIGRIWFENIQLSDKGITTISFRSAVLTDL